MYSSDPNSPDYVEDYDFFAVKRNERLDEIGKQKRQVDAAQRAEVKKRSLQWRATGTKAMTALKTGISGVRFLLEPHNNTRKTVALFERCMETREFDTATLKYCRHRFPLASRVLHSCTDARKRYDWFHNKTNLIVWKFAVMQEVRTSFCLSHPATFEYHVRPTEVRVLRHLFRTYMNNIPIEHSVSEELKLKRKQYRIVCDKLQLIHDTQRACAAISLCKSRQHTNPNGCSNCGVQYVGGMLGGGTPYVHSKSRDTGLVTLVTLEFELDTLHQEEIVQIDIVEQVGMDLQAFEEVVCGIVRVNIQAWWSVVLAWKRYKRKQARMAKSTMLYNRRRLVNMKHDVDRAIREASPLDMERYREVYWDILPAMYEYTAQQVELKHQRLVKWARCFRRKLVVLVEEARERQYQEYLRLMSLPKPPRPIVFRSIEPTDNTNLVCYRLECKMRKFLTKERYDIYMNTHYKQDHVRYARYDWDRAAKQVREAREHVVMQRITDSKLRIEYSTSEYGSVASGMTRESSVGSIADDESVGSQSGRYPEMSQVTVPSALGSSVNGSLFPGGSMLESEGADDASASSQAMARATGYAKRKDLKTDFSPSSSGQEGEISEGRKEAAGREMVVLSQALRKNGLYAADQKLNGSLKAALINSETSLLRDSQDEALNFESAQSVQDWAAMTHIYTLHSLVNDHLYSLELVSKQGEVDVPQRVALDRPLVRIGTHSSCECAVVASGAAKRESKVAKVHCLLFCPTHQGSGGTQQDKRASGQLVLVDNSTAWGTYVVSAAGTRKAPTKATAGMPLSSGLLLCIGVCKDGPAEISAIAANQACVVYRVRCLEQEAV